MFFTNLSSSINLKGFNFSIVAGFILFSMSSTSVSAQPSNTSLPVHGKGAPSTPTLSVPTTFKLNQPISAIVGSSQDPDEDPIFYEIRWCTEPNGAGNCVVGKDQTFTSPGNRYVAARAVTPRGFPQQSQGFSLWTIEVIANYTAVITYGGACGAGSTVSGYGKTFTCPITTQEADAAGVSYNASYNINQKTLVTMNHNKAQSYCASLEGGYRLPTLSELNDLYQIVKFQSLSYWPIDGAIYYGSTTPDGPNYMAHSLYQLNGVAVFSPLSNTLVSCVK